jgi:hypothetical protein
MRRTQRLLAVISILAFAGVASVLGNHVQKANSEPQPGPALQQAPPGLKSNEKSRAGLAKNQTKLRNAIAPTKAVPVAAKPPAFLSEEYIKKEQQTEDRLKKMMIICNGC